MQFFNFSDCRLNVNNGWYLGGEGHFWPCVCQKSQKGNLRMHEISKSVSVGPLLGNPTWCTNDSLTHFQGKFWCRVCDSYHIKGKGLLIITCQNFSTYCFAGRICEIFYLWRCKKTSWRKMERRMDIYWIFNILWPVSYCRIYSLKRENN